MWNNVKAKVTGLKILHGFCNYCSQRHASVGVWVKRTPEKHRRCGQVPGKTRLFATRNYLSTEPPWRVLFFGTDGFAVESLKLLSASRYDTHNNLHASEQREESFAVSNFNLVQYLFVLSHKSWGNSANRSGTRLELLLVA
jgi:hypothetical protein